jgi:hypothetical protein
VERHPRRTEDLEISEELATLLGSLRAAWGVTAPAELDVDRVRDVEAATGTRLPDQVLALIAADLGFLRDDLSVGLGEILAHSARARESRARGDLVVFGADPDGHVFHGFVIGAADDQIAVFDNGDRSLTSSGVLAWLADQAAAWEIEPVSAPPLVARLVRAAQPLPEGRRVRHKKWGIGRVLTEVGSGPNRKIKAAFPNLGIKAVAASFLEFLDDDAD